MAAKFPSFDDMLAALVAAPSVSSAHPALDSGNRQVIDLLAGWLDGAGFSCEIMDVSPGKANLIATVGGPSEPGHGLVLAGHTDTVPYDEGRWGMDPFSVTERDGNLYGLGTTDMKGFFAVALDAMRAVDLNALSHPLTLIATCDEETTMAGAKALAQVLEKSPPGTPLGRHCVIGEPTSLKPVRLHKGMLMEGITLTGRSGHSSDPKAGTSALDGMVKVMAELIRWREALANTHRDDRFKVPHPTLNLGHIEGGDNANRICGRCTLHLDLRALPGMDVAELRMELRERVEKTVADSGLTVSFTPLFDGVDPLETAADAPIVQAAEAITGQQAGAVTFGTEGPLFGRLGLETVILGPGDLACAHQPDEHLNIHQARQATQMIEALIFRFCGPHGGLR